MIPGGRPWWQERERRQKLAERGLNELGDGSHGLPVVHGLVPGGFQVEAQFPIQVVGDLRAVLGVFRVVSEQGALAGDQNMHGYVVIQRKASSSMED